MDSMFGLEDTAMQQKVSETHVYSKHSSKFFGIYKNTSCKKLSLGRSAEVTKKLIPSSYKSLLLPSASPSPRRFAALGLHSRNPHFLSSLFRFSLLYSRLCRKRERKKMAEGGEEAKRGIAREGGGAFRNEKRGKSLHSPSPSPWESSEGEREALPYSILFLDPRRRSLRSSRMKKWGSFLSLSSSSSLAFSSSAAHSVFATPPTMPG